jgi:conjugal transfer mating pair stabilization protein TraN
MSETGLAAQAEGTALAEEVILPEVDGSTITLFPGQAQETQLDFSELFPGSGGGDLADYTDLFGSDLEGVNAGQAAQNDLLTEDSATGDAYPGLRESVDRSHPDMTNDPLWSQTDEVLDNFEALAASFADCSIQTELTEDKRYTHVPDYRTCERVVDYSGACEIRHEYTIEEIFQLGAGGTFEPCGDGCVLWTVGRSFPTGPCYQELTGTLRVLKPEAIQSARLEELWYEDYIAGLWIDGTNYYSHTTGDCENSGSPTV